MAPEGLRLFQPATLTIESPKTVAASGFETVAFAYHQKGEGMYLSPSEVKGSVLSLEIWHFSGAGAAQGTSSDINTQEQQHVPADAEDAFMQQMRNYLGQQRQAQLLGQPTDPQFEEKVTAYLHEGYNRFVAPKLETATQDCDAAPAILSKALSFLRQVQLMQDASEFQKESNQIYDTIDKVKAKCQAYKASGAGEGVVWSGVVCSLAQPFLLTAVSSDGLTLPFQFMPGSPQGGEASYSASAYGVTWAGSGSYTVQGADAPNGSASLTVTMADSCATAPAGTYCKGFTVHIDLTPTARKGCG